MKFIIHFNLSLCRPGDGVESQSLQESPKQSSSIVIPEDFESQKEMVRRVINVFLQKLIMQICFLFLCFALCLQVPVQVLQYELIIFVCDDVTVSGKYLKLICEMSLHEGLALPTILTTTLCPLYRRSLSVELWLSWRQRGTRPGGNWRRSTGSTWQPGTRLLWHSASSPNSTATILFTTIITSTITSMITITITLRANIVTVNTVMSIQVRKNYIFLVHVQVLMNTFKPAMMMMILNLYYVDDVCR